MTTNSLVLAVVAVTLCQGIGGQGPPLQNVLEDALNKTRGLAAQAAAQSAGQQLQTIAHHLVMSGESVLNSSRGTIQGFADNLDEAVEKALSDLPECITSQRRDAAHLFTTTLDGVWRCVTDPVTEVGTLIADVAGLAGQAVLLPHQAAANITACLQYPLTAVFCIAQAVGSWGYESEKITAGVAADVAKGGQLFATAPLDVATCVASRVNMAAEGAHNITVSIAQCVVDRSKSSTTSSTSSTS